jgi:hypothetical protein
MWVGEWTVGVQYILHIYVTQTAPCNMSGCTGCPAEGLNPLLGGVLAKFFAIACCRM